MGDGEGVSAGVQQHSGSSFPAKRGVAALIGQRGGGELISSSYSPANISYSFDQRRSMLPWALSAMKFAMRVNHKCNDFHSLASYCLIALGFSWFETKNTLQKLASDINASNVMAESAKCSLVGEVS